jgi:hypothetical protein
VSSLVFSDPMDVRNRSILSPILSRADEGGSIGTNDQPTAPAGQGCMLLADAQPGARGRARPASLCLPSGLPLAPSHLVQLLQVVAAPCACAWLTASRVAEICTKLAMRVRSCVATCMHASCRPGPEPRPDYASMHYPPIRHRDLN